MHPSYAFMKTSIDILEDETSFFNIGQYKEEKYMQIKMEEN